MSANFQTPDEYIATLPKERQQIIQDLRQTILKNLPEAYKETISYGMIGYVVPHEVYPKGYHVNPELPLPFINIASQKNFVALYHSGIYSDEAISNWFKTEYPKHCKTKLNMGKSCIRFNPKKPLPLALIGELCQKISVERWIQLYETKLHLKK
jgi:uncharacterized protein YdhG (YjbR/CyaY superfamily)